MNDKQLVSFITVADKGSFYRAAQALYMTPQTLIQQMNQLEQEVGVRLFERNNKGVLLTAAGQEFHRGAQRMIDLTNETVERSRSAGSAQTESIRIGMPPMGSPLLPRICVEFSIRYPQIRMEMIKTEASDWVSLLCEEKVDVLEGDVSCDYAGFPVEMTKLVRDHRACMMSPAHPLAAKEVVSLSDLAVYRVCVHNLSWLQLLKSEIRAMAANVKLEERPCTLANVFETCLNGGVYLAPELLTPRFSPLISRPLDIGLSWDFGIAYLKRHSHAMDLFIETAKELYREQT